MSDTYILPTLTGITKHLINDGLISESLAKQMAFEAKQKNVSFIHYLVTNKIIESQEIMACCSRHLGLNNFDLDHYDTAWLSYLNEELIMRYRVLPLEKHNNTLQIGIADPNELHVLDILMFHTGLRMAPIIVDEKKLNQLIEIHCHKKFTAKSLQLLSEITHDENINIVQDSLLNKDEPLIQFVDQVIQQAIQQNASDIHVEPYVTFCRIRYRRDGVLHEVHTIPANIAGRLGARLKVMAKLDIAERRLPQDGRFQWHTIDIRINTCPTAHGEKIVLRLLDSNKITLDLNALGFDEHQYPLFLNKISAPQGLILVTGPTGSGKTVTLYSALNFLNTQEKNISTIEDPIEIYLTGINQVNINPKIGLDFSNILRSLLRQDPDVLMVGEIRDKETANLALQAAETGHLVLSTLHTNNAIETISRLKSMDIPIYYMVSAISLIIAQRLIRVLCSYCKKSEAIPKNHLGLTANHHNQTIFRAQGCKQCLNGYQGRIGLYEFLPLTEKIIELIAADAPIQAIYKIATKEGYVPLKNLALEKILSGITSIAEVQRVLYL